MQTNNQSDCCFQREFFVKLYLYSHTAKYNGTEKNKEHNNNITRLFTKYTQVKEQQWVSQEYKRPY